MVYSITFLSLSSVSVGAISQGLFRSCMKTLISLNLFFFSLKSYIKPAIRVARMYCGVNSSRSNSYTMMDRNWWHNSGCIPPKVTSGTEPHLPKVIPYSTWAFYYQHFTICFGAILFFLSCLIFSNPPLCFLELLTSYMTYTPVLVSEFAFRGTQSKTLYKYLNNNTVYS